MHRNRNVKDMVKIERYIEDFKRVFAETDSVSYAFIFGSSVKALRPGGDVDILVGERLSFDEKVDLGMKLESVVKRKVDILQSFFLLFLNLLL